jgi:RNA polymerase sigma-70 factor (ECF subfamily)
VGFKPRIIDGGGQDGQSGDTDPSAGQARSDAELTQLCLAGLDLDGNARTALPGEKAFTVLVERHQARVLRLARHLTGNAEEARDVAQDTFLRAFRSLDSYRPEFSFRNWLLKITVNASRDHSARGGRGRLRPVEEADGLADGKEPGAEAEDAVFLAQVRQAAAQLSERERDVFVLRDLEGIDVDEIAEMLGLAPPTVRRHLARARLHLRRLLG